MTLATHAYWGVLFASVFGPSFTSLTAATMYMSLAAALTLYVLLRYLARITLLAGTFVARMEFYTRYMLPILPFITAGLVSVRGQSVRALAPVLIGLAAVAACSAALHLDEYEFLSMRWGAGHALVAQGVPYTKINNGFMWHAYELVLKRD